MKSDKVKNTKNIPLKKSATTADSSIHQRNLIVLFIILIVAFIAYLPALKAGFVNWDDEDYVINNLLIRNFSKLNELLFTPVQGNIHPLTNLSLAINYSISGKDAWSYHLLNVLFHLANTILVFLFARKLSRGNSIISITTAMLFALHPMHVESVAWVAERKDVLYGFFFLLGLISYIKYADTNSRNSYLLCILWFLLSLASKPAAVIFPITLFTIDLFRKRKLSFSIFAEKIPFLVIAALLGYITLQNQVIEGALDTKNNFFGYERFFFGFYGFVMYLLKLIFPFNLATFYPYPPIDKTLPLIYFISPIVFIAFLILCIKTYKKSGVFSFGFSFYFVNLLLVIQFFLVGSAIIADRYTYIPYIGLYFILGWLLDKWKKQSVVKALPYLAAVGLFLAILTYKQSSTWFSSATLWDKAIKSYPSSKAFAIRAKLLVDEGQKNKALEYFTESIRLNKSEPNTYLGRGNLYFNNGSMNEALNDFNSALKINPDYIDALNGRGALYGAIQKNDLALNDLNKAIRLNHAYIMAYKNRAIVYINLKRFTEAIDDLNKYIESEPDDADIINTTGVCYQNLKQYDESIKLFDKAILINPKPIFYLNRSYSWNSLGKLQEARNDVIIARKGGVTIPDDYAKFYGL